MSRIKSVYLSAEVFHLWANRAVSHDIRNASGSISTRNMGDVLVSYGSHFVIGGYFTRADGASILLMNDDTRSITSSKHQGCAWRALPQHRRTEALYVPNLTRETFSADGLGMREVARACIASARSALEKCEKARQTFPHHLHRASARLETARKLYDFVGDKKHAVTVPTIPAECDKKTAFAIMQQIGADEFMRLAGVALQRARDALARAQNTADDYATLSHYYRKPATVVCERASEARRDAESARAFYVKAGRKAAPEVARIIKAATAIESAHAQAAHNERDAEYRAGLFDDAHRATMALARHQLNKKQNRARGISAPRYANLARHYAGPLIDESKYAKSQFPAELIPLVGRLVRHSAASQLIDAIESAECHPLNFDPVNPGRSYSVPTAAHVQAGLVRCANDNPRMVAPGGYWQTRADAIVSTIATQRAEFKSRLNARNADAVSAWRNGATNYLPSGLPTMARIVGDTVETSRGARVPLAHAVRLVRIAERVAARGGNTWGANDGPMVGHYRVSSIGADLSAVIGCHEFDAAESARLVAVIKQTAEFNAEPVAAE